MDRFTPSNVAKVVKKKSWHFFKSEEDVSAIASKAAKNVEISNDLSRGGRAIDVRPRATDSDEKRPKQDVESDSEEEEEVETESSLTAKKQTAFAALEIDASRRADIGYRSVDVRKRPNSPLHEVKDKYDRLSKEYDSINLNSKGKGMTRPSADNFINAWREFEKLTAKDKIEEFKREVLIPRLETLCYELETAIDELKAQ